ncbi:hypothetical protein JCM16303_002698 [Sporobolomyces ruberrimus]
MERTFAVLLASEDSTSAGDVADTLRQEGFIVVAQDRIPGEELAEAGLEIGIAGSAQRGDELMEYTVWVLEKDDAVRSLNDFKANRSVQPSHSDPDFARTDGLETNRRLVSGMELLTAPSPSAASMIIELLFPNLNDESPSIPAAESQLPASTLESSLDPPSSRPFPLSNLALAVHNAPPSSSSRHLSPKIAQALEELSIRRESPAEECRAAIPRIFGETSGGEDEEDVAQQTSRERASSSSTTAGEVLSTSSFGTTKIDRQSRPRSSTALSAFQASTTSVSSSISFKARPAPPLPTAQPRMTKSAALRLGIPLPPPTPRTKSSSSIDTLSSSTPRVVPTPKSLAAPSITPRLSKAAALRTGQAVPISSQTSRPSKRQSISTSERAALDRLTRRQSVQLPASGSAGHLRVNSGASSTSLDGSTSTSKSDRRMSVSTSLKSLREPTIVPRSTKSSSLRTGSTTIAPSVSRNRSIAILDDDEPDSTPPSEGLGHGRRHSIQVASTRPPAIEVRMSRASMLRNGQTVGPSSTTARTGVSNVTYEGVPGHKRRESVGVPSMHQLPTHTPRPNRASLLRRQNDSTSASAPSPISAHSRPNSNLSRVSENSTATPRLNRAAELRQKALAVKDQIPTTPQRGRTAAGGGGSTSSGQKTPRPASAMSDLSNGSRV